MWTAHCRQARADSISPGALQIGSPAFLHDNPTFGKHYYLAALVPLVSEQLDAQNPQLTAEPVPTCGGPRPAKPSRHMACLPSTGPFEGLLLGSLVGKGSFGRVYRGLWKGQLVGVKVGACFQLGKCRVMSCHVLHVIRVLKLGTCQSFRPLILHMCTDYTVYTMKNPFLVGEQSPKGQTEISGCKCSGRMLVPLERMQTQPAFQPEPGCVKGR